ncbi:RNA polymerase sigma factor [Chloroflexota bacterium]
MIGDEAHLIRFAQQGDAEACTGQYDGRYDSLCRHRCCRVTDVGLAQDLTSEVFVRMVDKLDTLIVRGRTPGVAAHAHRQNSKTSHLVLESAFPPSSSGEGDPARRVERRIQAECLAAALK